jgi:HEAT repeat protein
MWPHLCPAMEFFAWYISDRSQAITGAVVDSYSKICIIHGMKKLVLVMLAVFFACGLSPESKAKMILEQGLDDSLAIVRINTAQALIRIGDKRGSELLLNMLEDSAPEVQMFALEAMLESSKGKIHLDPVLIDLSKSVNASLREAAFGVIAAIEHEDARELLAAGIRDESAEVREIAARGLAKFNEVEMLENALHDTEIRVRLAAAQALGELGVARMAEIIKEELKKSTPDVLGTGLIALAELNDTSSINLFKALLSEGAGDLRVDAAEALLILEDKSGVDALRRALLSRDPFLRIHAAEVFCRHDIPEAYDELEAATQDELVNVALLAVKALAEHDAAGHRARFIELMDAQPPLLRIAAASAYLRSRHAV